MSASLLSKDEILAHLDKLPYGKRVAYAAELGKQHKGSPELAAWISKMREHPEPTPPAIEVEEGFSELLPKQKKNIAKFYHEDQIALTAAAAAKNLDVFKAELDSPSEFFKRWSARLVVESADDEFLVKKISAASPKLKKFLLHCCIDCRRVAVLERCLVAMEGAHDAVKLIPDTLHGCSASFVEPRLRTFIEKETKGLHWNKLAQFHYQIILDLMKEELAAANPLKRGLPWNNWYSRLTASAAIVFLETNTVVSGAILELWKAYPIIEYLASGTPTLEMLTPERVRKSFPMFIVNHLPLYYSRHLTPITDVLCTGIGFDCYNSLRASPEVPSGFWTHKKVDFLHKLAVAKAIMAKAPREEIFSSYGLVSELLSSYAVSIVNTGNPTVSQLVEWCTAFVEFVKSHYPGSSEDSKLRTYRSYIRGVSHVALTNINNIAANAVNESDPAGTKKKSIEVAHAKAAKLEPLYTKIFTLMCDAITVAWRKGEMSHEDIDVIMPLMHSIFPHVRSLAFTRMEPYFKASQGTLPKGFEHSPKWTALITRMHQLGTFTRDAFEATQEPDFRICKEWKDETLALVKQLHAYILNFYKKATLHFAKNIFEMMLSSPAGYSDDKPSIYPLELILNAFNLFSEDHIQHLGQNQPALVKRMLRQLPRAVVTKTLNILMAEGIVTEVVRDELLEFQDIDDPKVRNSLQKQSNSNNTIERIAALKSLVAATFDAKTVVQTLRTTKFIRTKIKNESLSQRIETLSLFIGTNVNIEGHFPADFNDELKQLWLDLLQDCLEIQDLDESGNSTVMAHHPLLQFFDIYSKAAITESYRSGRESLFDLGVELAWRHDVFRHGLRTASDSFTIPAAGYMPHHEAAVKNGCFEWIKPAYEKRIQEKCPTWADDPTARLIPSIRNVVACEWPSVPLMLESVEGWIKQLKESGKDDEGLLLIAPSGIYATVNDLLTQIESKYNENERIKAIREDFVLLKKTSTLLKTEVVPLYKAISAVSINQADLVRIAKRDEFIVDLLERVPSSIYLKFVWRHLVTYRQDLLDKYIGQKKTFRGLFYVEPAERKLANTQTPAPKPAVKSKTKKAKKPKQAELAPDCDPVATLAQRRAKEADVEADVTPLGDHRDFFCLEACFGLHKLLPRQVNALAQQFLHQVFNADRPVPERVKALIRYTVMPTTTYADIVEFLNKHETPKEEGSKPMAVNFVEALLKGVMRNDEPTAPLGYLLSPKFLGSDRARIAIFAVSRCVPFMPPGGMTKTLRMLLTGKRRTVLKITAYKEIIRLLMAEPTEEHLKIIRHEWDREEVHRDVRITMLQTAMICLHSNVDATAEIAWHILESSTKLENPEILTAVLGAINGGVKHPEFPHNAFEQPRLLEHLEALKKFTIPDKDANRFAHNVVLRLAETAKDEDIRFMAVAVLAEWQNFGVEEQVTPIITKYLSTFDSPLLTSIRLEERAIFQARWTMLISILMNFCGVTAEVSSPASIDNIVGVINALTKAIKELPLANRDVRIALLENLDTLHGCIPLDFSTRDPKNEAKEDVLLAALKPFEPQYWQTYVSRRAKRIAHYRRFSEQGPRFVLETLGRVVDKQEGSSAIMSTITQMLGDSKIESEALNFADNVWNQKFSEADDITITLPLRTLLFELGKQLITKFDYYLKHYVSSLVAFIDRAVGAARNGFTPLDTPNVAGMIADVARRIAGTDYTGSGKSFVLGSEAKKMLNIIFQRVFTAGNNLFTSNNAADMIWLAAGFQLVEKHSSYVVLALPNEDLKTLLHLIIQYHCVGVPNRNAACLSMAASLLRQVEYYQGISSLSTILDAMVDFELAPKATVLEVRHFQFLSCSVALAAIEAHWTDVWIGKPKLAARLLNWAFMVSMLDRSRATLYSRILQLTSECFAPTLHKKTSGYNTKCTPETAVAFLKDLIQEKARVMRFPFADGILDLSQFPVATRHYYLLLALDLLKTFASQTEETHDKIIEWRPEMVAVLDMLCTCGDADIERQALRVATQRFVGR